MEAGVKFPLVLLNWDGGSDRGRRRRACNWSLITDLTNDLLFSF